MELSYLLVPLRLLQLRPLAMHQLKTVLYQATQDTDALMLEGAPAPAPAVQVAAVLILGLPMADTLQRIQ